jgi:hypothetical protein
MKRILLAFVILLGFQTYAFSQVLPSGSLWQNQRGSTLEVFFADPSGPFQGMFTNQAPGFQCKGIPYPVTGTARNAAAVFAVTFVQCTSHTTWYGTVIGNTMRTNWTLIYFPPSGPPRTLQGIDVFTRRR